MFHLYWQLNSLKWYHSFTETTVTRIFFWLFKVWVQMLHVNHSTWSENTCIKKSGVELSPQDSSGNCSWPTSLSFVHFVKESTSNYNPNIKRHNFTGYTEVTCHLYPCVCSVTITDITQIQEESFPLKIFISPLKKCKILCTNDRHQRL